MANSAVRSVKLYWVDFSGMPLRERISAAWAVLCGKAWEMCGGEERE